MTSIIVIENKVSSVREYLSILERYKVYTRKQIEEDIDIRGAVERYLYLAVQSAIDLAEALVSAKNLRKPTTFSETFYILEEAGLISLELREELVKMAGFRNIIAHDYADVDYDIVFDVLQDKLADLEKFLQAVVK